MVQSIRLRRVTQREGWRQDGLIQFWCSLRAKQFVFREHGLEVMIYEAVRWRAFQGSIRTREKRGAMFLFFADHHVPNITLEYASPALGPATEIRNRNNKV